MKVLLAHNFYQQPGGEDQVFADEGLLLESHGHEVIRYTVHNDAVESMGRLSLAARTIWNRQSYRELRDLVRRERPAVAHFQNTFPLISPSAYFAVRREGAAVVQELPNYRLLCPAAVLFREGRACEDCVGKAIAWRGVVHKCYRGNRGATAVVAAMTAVHRFAGTWENAVDAYITLTEEGREKFIAGGLPADKLRVKGNFVFPDPGIGDGSGGYAVFVGRLSPEKGIDTLLEGWSRLQIPLPLKVVGDGPLAAMVQAAAAKNPAIQWLGRQPPTEVLKIVGAAVFLLCPSKWSETGGPKTVLESLAKGTPVIASRLGSMREVIDDGRTGLHFEPGNADDLADRVRAILMDRQRLEAMRIEARRDYESRFTAESNYAVLMQIYERARTARRSDDRRIDSPAVGEAPGFRTTKG